MIHDSVVLALDIGTSSCRASLYDMSGQALDGRAAHVSYAPRMTADGGADLNADTLLQDVITTIDGVLNAATPTPPIVAVGTSTFWHSLLGLDASGKPVTPLYLWLDARARGAMAGLRQRLDEHAVHARTGCVLHWTYWPARLSWLRDTAPETFQAVKRWISFGEFLRERLTCEPGVSVSMASGTGLLNLQTCNWDAGLIESLNLDPNILSTVVPLKTEATASRWPALKGVPWLPAVGDGACNNLGAGCASPDRLALMIGTSGAERAVWSPEPADHFTPPWGLWCYRVDERRVVLGGALNDGGSLVDWLRNFLQLQLPDITQFEAELAEMAPDSHGLTVLPFWGGERNPGWADDARGAIVGLRFSTRPLDVARACLEAVGLRFALIDELLVSATGNPREVIATGGALLHSPAWLQIIADALGRPLLASAEAEASSRGAALLALESVGLLSTPLDAMLPETTRRFEPNAEHTERYRAAADRQRHLYHALVG